MDLTAKPFFLTQAECEWVRKTLRSLTPRQKVGQLFCLNGQDYSAEERVRLVSDFAVGGILFRPEPMETIRAFYACMDWAAAVPLLKAANLEEGGSGGCSDATFFGWPMAAAAAGGEEEAAKLGAVCGYEARQAGINWTFSPVCDLSLNPLNPIINVRSFGSDPETVKTCALAYLREVQARGVAACAKHFPGDGVDYRDQHLHPTYNSLPAGEWYRTYGAVYRALIDGGVMSVMAGHIVQPAVIMERNPALTFGDCLPASLCPELLRGVLREKFGFNGVITTDGSIMGGFTQAMARRDAVPAAIMAGCDMIVFSTDFYEDCRYMLDALDAGVLTPERLDEAVTRLLALKARVLRRQPEPERVPCAEYRRECAGRCVTLVKDARPGLLPLSPEKTPDILLLPLGKDLTPDGSMTEIAREFLTARGFRVEVFREETAELHGTASLSPRRLCLYLSNLDTASNQTSVRIHWIKKHALNSPRHPEEEPSVFVSFANPYHLQDVPRVKTYVNAYSCHRDTIEAALARLTGEEKFEGVSPVDAFCGLPDTRL